MFSEASSDQLCVRNGAGYDEVYHLGLDDPDTSSDDQVLSSNSPSVKGDEDVNVDGLEDDSSEEYIVSAEPSS